MSNVIYFCVALVQYPKIGLDDKLQFLGLKLIFKEPTVTYRNWCEFESQKKKKNI